MKLILLYIACFVIFAYIIYIYAGFSTQFKADMNILIPQGQNNVRVFLMSIEEHGLIIKMYDV